MSSMDKGHGYLHGQKGVPPPDPEAFAALVGGDSHHPLKPVSHVAEKPLDKEGAKKHGDKTIPEKHPSGSAAVNSSSSKLEPSPSPSPTPKPSKHELLAKAHDYIPSILDPDDDSIDRMMCPPINETRYSHLQETKSDTKPTYFFAINLRECVDLLPRLMGSVLEAIRFLGPENCALSIVEGNSYDGTLEVLELLKDELEEMGTPYYLRRSGLNPGKADRIERLAALRQMAISPITGIYVPEEEDDPGDPPPPLEKLELAPGAIVLFLNDVAACAEDILELAHQRIVQRADMTCAMDWAHIGPEPFFYDVWIARTIGGDTFFDIPVGTGNWDHADWLFPWEPATKKRLDTGRPFQVFACWNGAVAFSADPVVRGEIRFRRSAKGECFQGEPQLFCKDMWYRGRGKIAVVPSVNLQYTDELGRRAKKDKGYVSDWVAKETDEDEEEEGEGRGRSKDALPPMKIDWKLEPPKKVKCMPVFNTQSWLPWNESLPLKHRFGS